MCPKDDQQILKTFIRKLIVVFLGNTYRSHAQAAFGLVHKEKEASTRGAWGLLHTTPADGGGPLQRAVVLPIGQPQSKYYT